MAAIEKQSSNAVASVDFADIPHSFDFVAQQVERGLNSLKRNTNYLRKVCDAKIAYHAQIQKLSRAETINPIKDEHGSMPRFNKAFESMTSSLTSLAEKENSIALLLMKEVVEQLDVAVESATVARKAILLEEKKATTGLRAMYEAKTKQRAALLKVIDELKAEKERERLASIAPPTSWQEKAKAKMQATLKKDPEKMRRDIYELAVAYKECVKDANVHQTRYYREELPAVMAKMQRLEYTRLATMEIIFNRLVQVHTEAFYKCMDECSAWMKTLGGLDKAADISDFVDGVIVLNGSALPPLQFAYDIMVSPEDIKANRLDGVPEKSVFHKTLTALMALQQVSHPILDVPITLQKLIETIRLKGGLTREGIFRNPPRQEELEESRRVMENGTDVSNLKFTDVDVPASLLKAWLRDLAEPIVPHDKFQEAIELSQLPTCSNAQMKSFIQTWPLVNQRVFEVLADLLDELSSAQNAPYTKMSLSSFGIVFAPCLLKNPSEDVLELMNSSKFEARFVGIALAAVMDREEAWKTALAGKQQAEMKQKAKLEQLVKEREDAFAILQAEQEKQSRETRVLKEDVAFSRLLTEQDNEQKVKENERARLAMEEERRTRREQRRKEDLEIQKKLLSLEGRAEVEKRDAEKKEQEKKEAEEIVKKELERKENDRKELKKLEQERQAEESRKEEERKEQERRKQVEKEKLDAFKLEVARLQREETAKKQIAADHEKVERLEREETAKKSVVVAEMVLEVSPAVASSVSSPSSPKIAPGPPASPRSAQTVSLSELFHSDSSTIVLDLEHNSGTTKTTETSSSVVVAATTPVHMEAVFQATSPALASSAAVTGAIANSPEQSRLPTQEATERMQMKKEATTSLKDGGVEVPKKFKKPPPPAPKDIEKSAPPGEFVSSAVSPAKQEESAQQQTSDISAELVHISRPVSSANRKKPSPPQFQPPASSLTSSSSSVIDENSRRASLVSSVPSNQEQLSSSSPAADVETQAETKKLEEKKCEEKDVKIEPMQVVPAVFIDDLLAKDANDEDMQKYKRSLIPTAQFFDVANPNKVILSAVVLRVSGRPDVVIPMKDLETSKNVLKESVSFSLGIHFYVQHDITSCIQWANEITRMKVVVGKKTSRLGARAPQTEYYSFFMPEEVAPSGMMGRGLYSCTARLFDDDASYATFKYYFEVKKEWE